MKSNYIFIAGNLALSNGEHIQGEHYHTWNLKNGMTIVTSSLQRYALVITKKLVENPKDPEQVLNCLNAGGFDNLGVSKYGGHDVFGDLRTRLNTQLTATKKKNVYDAKIAELDARYSNIDKDLKQKVKWFDRYYAYSDDINVYRRGKAAEEALNNELAESGESAQAYAKEYFAIAY